MRVPMRARRLGIPLALLPVLLVGCTPSVPPGSADGPGATSSPAPSTASGDRATTSPTPQSPEDSTATSTPDDGLLEQAGDEVATLSTERLAGQLVVASYAGTDPAAAADLVATEHLAGVITLGANVPDDPALRVSAAQSMTDAVGEAVAADGRDWPAFIGVDQEGGPIARIGAPLDTWPSAMTLGAADDPDLARRVAMASGQQLRALGYTVVFAPDADVTAGADDPTIGVRSPGSDPQLVARTAVAQARGFTQGGLVSVAKHFPGHGSVSGDTHLGSVVQPATREELLASDLVPFERLAEEQVPGIMTAHIVVPAIDPDHPATLSAPILTDLLREDLAFEGLIVTDALNMGAVSGSSTPAVAAVQAGADVLLMPPDPVGAVDELVSAVQRGDLTRERLEESAARVVAALRRAAQVQPAGPEQIGADADLALEAAGAGITQLSGRCGARLVGERIQVTGGSQPAQERLRSAAREAGLATGGGDTVTLLGGQAYQAGGDGDGAAAGAVRGDVVVATGVPYALGPSRARTALVATYDDGFPTMTALVQVLLGERTASGQLPVRVSADLPAGSGCPQ